MTRDADGFGDSTNHPITATGPDYPITLWAQGAHDNAGRSAVTLLVSSGAKNRRDWMSVETARQLHTQLGHAIDNAVSAGQQAAPESTSGERTPGQHHYLATGGDPDRPRVLTVDDIRHYLIATASTDLTPWDHIYRIEQYDGAMLEPVTIRTTSETNGDLIHLTVRVEPAHGQGAWYDETSYTVDGRA
jgi:hypothetical protein